MKKLLLVFTMIFSVAVFSQKESNGKLYIEHPAIEIVNQFNEAYTSGDLDKLKELVTENFQVRTLKDRKSNDVNWILGTSNYLSKNIVDLEIKHYGGSYPDVLEYKQDGIVDVKTYEWLTGYDKNTGLDINMPRYATYRMNAKGDKVAGLWINDDETLWQKNWDAYETSANGGDDDPDVHIKNLFRSTKDFYKSTIQVIKTQNTFVMNNYTKAEILLSIGWRISFIIYAGLISMPVILLGWFSGAFLTIYLLSYLPHKPYKNSERWKDTNIQLFPVQWFENFIFKQNLHAIHHLFPRVPFYNYRKVFEKIEPSMRIKKTPIVRIFDHKPIKNIMR